MFKKKYTYSSAKIYSLAETCGIETMIKFDILIGAFKIFLSTA